MSALQFDPARINDPNSVENGIVFTAATAGLALIDPRTLGVGGRLAYRSALAALTGWVTWTALRTEEDYLLPGVAKAGFTAGVVGATLGFAEAGEALDGKLHDALARMGVRKPRLAMAAATAALGVTAWWSGTKLDDLGDGTEIEFDDGDFEPEYVDVPEEVRVLATALLGATDSFGAAELRAQLDAARAEIYLGEIEDAFYPGIGFTVPKDLPRAVPGDASFPAIGRYHPVDGRSFDVRLHIQEGRIASLDVVTGEDWSEAEIEEWIMTNRSTQEITHWPAPEELTFLIETREGLAPVHA